MAKGGTYTKPSIIARKPPMTQERARYLMQTAFARVEKGSECKECFSFGAHASWCDTARG